VRPGSPATLCVPDPTSVEGRSKLARGLPTQEHERTRIRDRSGRIAPDDLVNDVDPIAEVRGDLCRHDRRATLHPRRGASRRHTRRASPSARTIRPSRHAAPETPHPTGRVGARVTRARVRSNSGPSRSRRTMRAGSGRGNVRRLRSGSREQRSAGAAPSGACTGRLAGPATAETLPDESGGRRGKAITSSSRVSG
jgi:hypothetical protein